MEWADVTIIGGGLAGIWTAFEVAKRGFRVLVLERASGPFLHASGNRDALVMPYLGISTANLQWRFYSKAFDWGVRAYRALNDPNSPLMTVGGVAQFPSTARLAKLMENNQPPQFSKIHLPSPSIDLIGVPVEGSFFHVPESFALHPSMLIPPLLRSSSISVILNTRVEKLTRIGGGEWEISLGDTKKIRSPYVVLCNAFEASVIEPLLGLPLEPVRGETLLVRSTRESSQLKIPLSFDGYLTPAVNGAHLLGSHYRHHDRSSDPDETVHEAILNRIRRWVPALTFSKQDIIRSRVCFRTSTLDRLPLVGPAIDSTSAAPLDGLFLNCGHGSRGFTSCPISAEIIARYLAKEALGVLSETASLVLPSLPRTHMMLRPPK